MRQLTVAALAKINLSLDVVGRRPDGYHLLATIMQSLELADQVRVGLNTRRGQIGLTCDRPGIPRNSRNTAFKAAQLFLEATNAAFGVDIDIVKRIPASAGLAGGSTDAAAVLFALDQLLPGCLTRPELFSIAAKVGADVPFCLQGGTVFCEGIGEQLTPLPALDQVPVLLLKPDFGLSTPWVFNHLDRNHLGQRPDHQVILDALKTKDLSRLAAHTANVLESVSLPAYPVLRHLKELLRESDASLVLMSGSGPTVFGLFDNQAACDLAMKQLIPKLPPATQLFSTRTASCGPQVITLHQEAKP